MTSFHEIYERYAPHVYRFVFWLSGSVEEVEDITSGWLDSLDEGAGWTAMDGPISNMSAKGVTGNLLPNQHEIGGRSGEGGLPRRDSNQRSKCEPEESGLGRFGKGQQEQRHGQPSNRLA